MNEQPLISIIVPIYNTEKFLRRCFDSIINQTYENLQIILVNDGSTDGSAAICDEYAKKDNRIQVLHKENSGVTTARNDGLDLAVGEYVGFIDSDDWIEPNMYEEMLENITKTDADIVHTGVIREQNGIVRADCKFETCIIDDPRNDVNLWKSFFFVHEKFFIMPFLVTKLFKKDLIKYCLKNVPEYINFGEDRISTTEYLLKCDRLSLLKKSYYHYNISRIGSYTSNIGAERIIWLSKMFEQVRNVFYKYDVYEKFKIYWENSVLKYALVQLSKTNIVIRYLFSHVDKLDGKNIIIYGAGNVGYNYYIQLSRTANCNIIDWVDKQFSSYDYPEQKVNPISNIKNVDYDLIIIAVKYKNLANKIIDELISIGIDENKLCWYEPIESCYLNEL